MTKSNNQNSVEYWKSILNRCEIKIAAKAGIAAIMSYIAGYLFSLMLEHPNPSISSSWAVLSTFVVLQAHLGGTYRAAWVRFLGTAVGAFIGGLFTTIFGFHILTLGMSIFMTVIICSLMNINESIRIACMSTAVVMLLWELRPTVSPWTFGLFRFLDSTIGILVAVIVAHAFWPAQALTQLRKNLAKTTQMLRRYFRLSMKISPEPKHYKQLSDRLFREIIKLLEENRKFLEDSKLEILSRSSRLEEWNSIIDQLESIFDSLIVLETFRDTGIEKLFDKQLREQLENTIQMTDQGFQQLSKVLTDEKVETFSDLRDSITYLNEDLLRFRTTRKTRELDRTDVEEFFVYFYNLRGVTEEILRVGKRCCEINATESE